MGSLPLSITNLCASAHLCQHIGEVAGGVRFRDVDYMDYMVDHTHDYVILSSCLVN
jgi:hypothetical protein